LQLIVHWFCQQKCRIYLSLGTGRVEAGTESEGECLVVLFNNDDIFFSGDDCSFSSFDSAYD
jgi:hypothetical protein